MYRQAVSTATGDLSGYTAHIDDTSFIEKQFYIGWRIYNIMVKEAKRRCNRLFADKSYKQIWNRPF